MADDQTLRELFPASLDAVPAAFRVALPIEQREYLLNGELRQWSGPLQEVRSPICLRRGSALEPQVLGHYPRLTEQEALAAVAAASQAFDHGRGAWPTLAVSDRIRHVEDFVFRIKAKRAEVVNLLMWEIGKNNADAQKEFDRTIDYVRDTIDALKDLDRGSSRFEITQGIIGQVRRSPLGVVLCMGPFNYPLNETFTTLIPALIMGNTVVFKPPKLGVLLHRPLLEAFRDAFPPGVVNTVYGEGKVIIGPMLASGRVDVLAFIGSSQVADLLKKQHPHPHRFRCVLGLDAKNPAIVLPDADLELTVKECVLGSLSYNGQRCTALKILFVHERVLPAFLERFTAAVNQLTLGMPWADANITPLPEPGKPQRMADYIQDAVSKGGRVANAGGGAWAGTLCRPAVVCPVAPTAQLYTVEQFGPVVPVLPFRDLEEPIRYLVESDYGQQASVFGSDPDQIARLVDPLVNQVCRLNLNCQCQRGPDTFPFTGRKASAEGTLSVTDALRVFAIRTMVAAKASDLNQRLITTITREHKSNFLSTDFIF